MDSGYYVACTALKTQASALELAANNIANVNTTGYPAAQLDKRRAGKLATAIQTAFEQRGSLPPEPADVGGLSATGVPTTLPIGNTDTDEFSLLKGQIENAMAGEIAGGDVAVRRTSEGLVISLREIGFFDTGSDEIKSSSQPAFSRLAAILRQTNRDLRIEGPYRQHSHPQFTVPFKLGPFDVSGHRDGAFAHPAIWLQSRATRSLRIC